MDLAATQQEILQRLKTRGPQSIKILANQLDITTMGVRQHITELAHYGLVAQTEETRQTRGRPVRYWQLTDQGHKHFPDGHAETNLQLIQSIRGSMGAETLDQLVAEGFNPQQQRYSAALELVGSTIEDKLARLAELRSEDGYMAEIRLLPDGWLLIENHCPIYSAASACNAYCHSELEMLQALLTDHASVERIDHALAGSRRCAFKIQRR